jgi:hypothetical protein
VKRPNDGLSVESRQALNTFRNLAVRTTAASKSGLYCFPCPKRPTGLCCADQFPHQVFVLNFANSHLRVFLGIVSGPGSNCIWFCDDAPASRSITPSSTRRQPR